MAIFSDEFNGASLGGGWTFINPSSDCSVTESGGFLNINVATGSDHDLSDTNNTAPRVVQTISGNFDVSAQFASAPSQQVSGWGFYCDTGSTNNFVRADIYFYNGDVKVYAASWNGTTFTEYLNSVLAAGYFNSGCYLRFTKSGNTFTFYTSANGSTWDLQDSWTYGATITRLGLAANNFDPDPAVTAQVNYFHVANATPTANAGVDQTVDPAATVQLDGSASSDSDGTIATYAWTQISGTTVTLSSTSVASPTFQAPINISGAILVFGLTVTDNLGASSTQDTVTIAVRNVASRYIRLGGSWNLKPIYVRSGGIWKVQTNGLPSTVPDAPTNVSATPGDQQVTVSWTAPANNGGSAITGYTVTRTPSGQTTSVSSSTTSTTITGLTNGTSYTFTVHATNANGNSAESAGASATPTASGGATEPTFNTGTLSGNVGSATTGLANSSATQPSSSGTSGSPVIIQNMKFTNSYSIDGFSWITFRNCWFTGGATDPVTSIGSPNAGAGIRFENCTLGTGVSKGSAGFFGGSTSVSNPIVFVDCAIMGEDGVKPGDNGNVTFTHCYISALGWSPSHGDGSQSSRTDPADRAGDNITFTNCAVYGTNNDCIFLQDAASGSMDNIMIDGCWLRSLVNGSEHTSFNLHVTAGVSNLTVRNTKFDASHADDYFTVDDPSSIISWSGNTDYTSGTPIASP